MNTSNRKKTNTIFYNISNISQAGIANTIVNKRESQSKTINIEKKHIPIDNKIIKLLFLSSLHYARLDEFLQNFVIRSYHCVDTKTVLRGLRHAQISFEGYQSLYLSLRMVEHRFWRDELLYSYKTRPQMIIRLSELIGKINLSNVVYKYYVIEYLSLNPLIFAWISNYAETLSKTRLGVCQYDLRICVFVNRDVCTPFKLYL
ncbi:hypothetical protein AGLY_005892 [Aphis glycines]|uniref:Uncharacterized protein n=1 Tax=Aphis glycines TaxID=307491 RepID=A0A6G0TT40_APHGL|nr:hypothetical protein AGLY_005892 [Aphis glycines]